MGSPKILRVPLKELGYYMNLDIAKIYCKEDSAHWHLCKNGIQIGEIRYDGRWTDMLPVYIPESVLREAEMLTKANANKIYNYYYHNQEDGADYWTTNHI